MAGQDATFLLEGGMPGPTLTGRAGIGDGRSFAISGSPKAHHSVIALVLVAVAILFLLDKAGFRFAVTAGRR